MSRLLDKLTDIADKLKVLETHYATDHTRMLTDEEVKLLETLDATINSLTQD
jgi:hypothetical protein